MHNDTDDATPIDTLEIAAIVVSAFVSQGRIGPINLDDHEAETLLAQLAMVVRQQEPK